MASERRASRLGRGVVRLAGVVACVLAMEATAAAGGPSAAEKETARTLMDEGDDRMEAHDAATALKAYQRADAIMHLPMTAVAVARAEEALGLLREARETALAVAATAAQPGEVPAYAKARAEAQAIADRVAQRLPVPPRAAEATPTPIPIPIGPDPIPDVAPPAGPRLSPLVAVGFGAGGAALVVGAVTGGLSWSKTSQLAAVCGPSKQQCPAGSLSTPKTLANVSNVALGLGIAGLGVGVVGVVLSRRRATPSPVAAIRLVVGPGSLGVGGEL